MVTVFYHGPVNAVMLDGLTFDSLAGKHQKHQNFPCQKLRYTWGPADYASIILVTESIKHNTSIIGNNFEKLQQMIDIL